MALGQTSPPITFDFSGGLRHWGYLGNDVWGDCVPAATEHLRMAKAVAATSTVLRPLYHVGFRPPGAPYTRLLYAQFLATLGEKPGPNQGVYPSQWLNWLMAHQPHPLLIGWAPWPLQGGADAAAREAASQFTGALIEYELTPRAYAMSSSQEPWGIAGTTAYDQPSVRLFHEVALVRATPKVSVVVTWGQNKDVTPAFADLCTQSIIVCLMEEDTWRPDFPEKLAALRALPGAQVNPGTFV